MQRGSPLLPQRELCVWGFATDPPAPSSPKPIALDAGHLRAPLAKGFSRRCQAAATRCYKAIRADVIRHPYHAARELGERLARRGAGEVAIEPAADVADNSLVQEHVTDRMANAPCLASRCNNEAG